MKIVTRKFIPLIAKYIHRLLLQPVTAFENLPGRYSMGELLDKIEFLPALGFGILGVAWNWAVAVNR